MIRFNKIKLKKIIHSYNLKKKTKQYGFKIFSFFGYLNLNFLSIEKKEKVIKNTGFIIDKAIEIFRYKKNTNQY